MDSTGNNSNKTLHKIRNPVIIFANCFPIFPNTQVAKNFVSF